MIKKSNFHDLPTKDFIQKIASSVDKNQVTILAAETGAGKSSQVPQYLAEYGYEKIIVTQPRILAARNLCLRVREEWAERNSEDSTEIIGFRTANENDDSGKSKILFCTDGLQLVREITGIGTKPNQILILDEVHEWNENMEVLIAWAKKRVREEPQFKILIMSATFDVLSLAEYFETDAIINIPGRHFEVKKSKAENLLAILFEQMEDSRKNILAFLPGKSEIQDVALALKNKAEKAGIEILPLHSQLEISEQQKVFSNYPNGKIILATNIAQTSVTIDDIDLVIDSGLERRNEVRSGVEGLFISQISQADCLQRAGRAGRTKAGEYILAGLDSMECLSFEEREKYPIPEILRKHIDRLTLRLANIGIDIEVLEFYHNPSKPAIKRARKRLISLGALTENGEITSIGREMERFPVQSNYARMLTEAKKFSDEVKAKLATIIAIQEINGIVKSGSAFTGWRKFTKQTKSDLLAQYDVFLAINSGQIDPEKYVEFGIISKNVIRAKETENRLLNDLGVKKSETKISGEEEEFLLKAIISGQIDLLWILSERNVYENIYNGDKRELSSGSVVKTHSLISAEPFDLQITSFHGNLEILHLLQGVTSVRANWLISLAPHMFKLGKTEIFYDPRLGSLAKKQQLVFRRKVLNGANEPILENTARNQHLFRQEFIRWAFGQIQSQRQKLENYYGREIPTVARHIIEKELKLVAPNIISLDELDKDRKKYAASLGRMETYFDESFWRKLSLKKANKRTRVYDKNYKNRSEKKDWQRKNHKW